MKNQRTPSDHEVLTGLVERITYQNAENGFCVLRVKARGHRELVTLVGHAAAISAGEWITASGNWINDRTGRAPVQSPVPQDLCAHAGRGHREVSRLGNDPRHWPGSQHNLRGGEKERAEFAEAVSRIDRLCGII